MVSTRDGGFGDLANFDHCPMDPDPEIHNGSGPDTIKNQAVKRPNYLM